MSLIQFLRILVARRWMILATMLACLSVATVVALLLPKRYPATARVMLDIVRPDPVTGQSIGGRDARGYVRTQIELIKDMRVAGAVVDRLGLANDPNTIASYEASGRSAADGGVRAFLGQRIIDNTSAALVSGSNILEIQYEAASPDIAKQVVTVLREAYIESSLRFRTDAAGRTGDWYREQANKAQQQLAAAEAELSNFMRTNKIVIQNGLDSEAAKLQSLQNAVSAARSNESATAAVAAGRLANDPVVDQLRVQLATVEDELALADARLGSAHPTYKAIEARRNTLREQMSQAQSNSRAGVAAVSGATRRTLSQLEADLASQEQRVLERKPMLDELMRLSREVDLRRDQYQKAAARAAELRLEADASETGLVILGDATASRTPSYPKVPLIIGLSALFGLVLGVLAAIVTEFIARRVRGQEDLAYATGVPVLVTVGSATPSPLRQRVQRLLGRRRPDEGGDLQAI